MINKLTVKQVERLNALLVLGFEYVARDEDCLLYAYNKKPFKHSENWSSSNFLWLDNIFFTKDMHFIKWTDFEPTLIKDLMKGEKNE